MLEESVQQHGEFRFPQFQGWFTVFLAEAYRFAGQVEKALDLAQQGLDIARDARSLYGIASAQRVLGRIFLAKGALSDAAGHFDEALLTSASMQARYDVARTHLDLAVLAQAQGRPDGASRHVGEAHRLFQELRVPRYVERAEALATELGPRL